MFNIIAFLIVIAGAVNWFTIGMLQYDYIAGIFGTQANIFSRLIYSVMGMSGIYIFLITLFKGGKLTLSFKKAKKKVDEKKKAELLKEIESEYKEQGYTLPPLEKNKEDS